MAMINFDASAVEAPSFDPIPAGDYECVIIDSQLKENRAGTGEYLELTIEIIEGEHRGRRVWERLNIRHENAKAEEMARQNLARLCNACGVLRIGDTCELHDIPFIASIRTRTAPDGNIQNEIKGYKEKPKAAPRQDPYMHPTPTQPKASTSPWARKQ